ncbi:hypothetical protein FRC12_013080 [Ceratobasidium sp. 428]|nr:hypothetical protein FRC12_013080 [Ceratobasidium sp. 428]
MPWIEQVAEELRPLSSNNHPTLTEGETSIGHLGTRDEGVEDGESWEEDDWDQECLTCALCRRGGLDGAMSTFATIPDMFDHLRNVHDVSDPQRGIVLGDSNSIMSSPYFRIDE